MISITWFCLSGWAGALYIWAEYRVPALLMPIQQLAVHCTFCLSFSNCVIYRAQQSQDFMMVQKTKPMAVGGIGMVCTANYNARKFGIRAAMPGFIARKLCPELVFVKPDFQKYTKASQATRAILKDFDPDFEAGSLDEAYLDITAYCEQYGMTGLYHNSGLTGLHHIRVFCSTPTSGYCCIIALVHF